MSRDSEVTLFTPEEHRILSKWFGVPAPAEAQGCELAAALEPRALLFLGLTMEKARDFEAAASYYARGIETRQGDTKDLYFLRNNLAFSLNQLGRFEEAERWSRLAIEVDGERHNAHKNLGVALAGQQQRLPAAESFVRALELCPRDDRALGHLADLIIDEPDLLEGTPDLRGRVVTCVAAVDRQKQLQ